MRSELVLRLMKAGLLAYGVVARERRPGVTILVYHRVGGGTARQLDLPVDLFEWQMQYLKRCCAVVTLDDVAALAQERTRETRDAVAITFDDGYEDTYHNAFPLLARYRLPATVYVTTACVEERRPFPFESSLPEAERGRPLTWRQAGEMVASGLVDIGAHTHTHPDLRRLAPAEVQREVDEANRLIAQRLGVDPAHFAYPWGLVSPAAREVVTRAYRTAAVGGTRKNPYGAIDLGALLRVPIQRSDGRLFFRSKLGSYLAGEEWLRAFRDRKRDRSGFPAVLGETGIPR